MLNIQLERKTISQLPNMSEARPTKSEEETTQRALEYAHSTPSKAQYCSIASSIQSACE